jgi:hypothetical protein
LLYVLLFFICKIFILPVSYALQKFLEDYGMIWVGETNEDAEEANDTLLSARSAASWEPRSYILLFFFLCWLFTALLLVNFFNRN